MPTPENLRLLSLPLLALALVLAGDALAGEVTAVPANPSLDSFDEVEPVRNGEEWDGIHYELECGGGATYAYELPSETEPGKLWREGSGLNGFYVEGVPTPEDARAQVRARCDLIS